jgi:hypothetical protein
VSRARGADPARDDMHGRTPTVPLPVMRMSALALVLLQPSAADIDHIDAHRQLSTSSPRGKEFPVAFHDGSPTCAAAMISPLWSTNALLPPGPGRNINSPAAINTHTYRPRAGALAVQLSGHLRDSKIVAPEATVDLSRIMQALRDRFTSVDLFVHTWSTREAHTKAWRPYDDSLIKASSLSLAHELVAHLRPKLMLVEEFSRARLDGDVDPNKTSGPFDSHSRLAYKSQIHGIAAASWLRRCYQRERNGLVYDLVLRLRPDVHNVGPRHPLAFAAALTSTSPSCVDPWVLHGPHSNLCVVWTKAGKSSIVRPIDPGSKTCGGDNIMWASPPIFDAIFGYLDRRFDAIIGQQFPHKRMVQTAHMVELIHNALFDLHIRAARCVVEPSAQPLLHTTDPSIAANRDQRAGGMPMPIHAGRGEFGVDSWVTVIQ